MNKKLVLGIALIIIVLVVGLNFGQHLTLDNAKLRHRALIIYREQLLRRDCIIFCKLCSYHRTFNPRCSRCYLIGRRIFCRWILVWYLLLVPSGNACLFNSRYLLRDWVQKVWQ